MADPCEPYGTCADEDSRFNANTTNPEANKYCPNNNPFVEFAGFKWWTNFHWSQQSGTYVWEPFKSIFDPYLVQVTPEGLKLQILRPKSDQQDQTVWRTSEVCTAENLGYGLYLFTAYRPGDPFAFLDVNAVFGAFTYQYYGEKPNVEPNCHRELDALEVIAPDGKTNAQFTVQPYDKIGPSAMYRFSIPSDKTFVTGVMDWKKGSVFPQCTYYIYYGDYDLENIPPTWNESWSPSYDPNLKKYIPVPGCQRFHLNLWLMHGKAPAFEQSVIIKRFQFRPSL